MAFANVQNSGLLTTSSGAVLTWTPSSAATVGNLLTCRAWTYQTAANAAADSSGTPKVFNSDVSSINSPSDLASSYIDSLVVPSGLTTPLKARNGSSFVNTILDEWSGNATSSVLDTTASNFNSLSTPGINTSASAGLVLAVFVNIFGTGTPVTAGTSFVQNAVVTGTICGSSDSRTTSAASQTGLQDSWTGVSVTTNDTNTSIASYNAGGAAAQDTPELYGRPRMVDRQIQQLLAQ